MPRNKLAFRGYLVKTHLSLNQSRLSLPEIDLLNSEQAFADAFLRAAQITSKHLRQIKSATSVAKDFTKQPFDGAVLGLFSKMCSHYYSYVLLEIHQDYVGSQLLLEHLCETAITITYLIEEIDKSLFSDYISASIYQAHYLLTDTEKLQQLPNQVDLLLLRNELKALIAEQELANGQANDCLSVDSWGPQGANTTAKRGAVIGLNFLCNPARQVAIKVVPASWLDVQLNYSNSSTGSSVKAKHINFTSLRDATHLCLHAAQTFLEEVSQHQNTKRFDIKYQQQSLNNLYEWFYSAHCTYQLHYSNSK